MDNLQNARGAQVLDSPSLNKGTGFTFTQRERPDCAGCCALARVSGDASETSVDAVE